MRKDIFLPLLAAAGGGVGFVLRYWQRAGFFDERAMLFQEGAPATAALLGMLALLALASILLTRGGRRPEDYRQGFSCPCTGYMTLMTAGGFLLLASAGLGMMSVMEQFTLWRMGAPVAMPIMPGLTAALCLPAGVAALMLGKGNYRDALPEYHPLLVTLPAYVLLPWIVAQYQANSRQPETLLFLFTVLALVFSELGFYTAAGFAFGRAKPKVCLVCSIMGTALLITTLADRPELFSAVLSMACVLLLLAQIAALSRNVFGPSAGMQTEKSKDPDQN